MSEPQEIAEQILAAAGGSNNILKAAYMVHKGDISLSVWRWEATDIKTLKKAGLSITNLMKDAKDKYKDIVRFPVEHGIWEFTHYYDTSSDIEDEDTLFIYSEFKLRK